MRNQAIERPQKIELYARNADSRPVICTSRSRNPVIWFIVTTDKSICSLSHILNVLDIRPVSRDSMDMYLRNDPRWRNILQDKLRRWCMFYNSVLFFYIYILYIIVYVYISYIYIFVWYIYDIQTTNIYIKINISIDTIKEMKSKCISKVKLKTKKLLQTLT